MNDFTTPRRMSASAFVILFVKAFREIAGASLVALIYLLFREDGDKTPVGILLSVLAAIGILVGLSLFTAFQRYYFRKFHIEGDKLIYSHGFAARQTMSIPLSSIHNLRTKRGLVYRILDMRGVAFDTLADKQQEVELILDESDWNALLARVATGERQAEAIAEPVPPPMTETWTVSDKAVVRGALCQNHLRGFAVLSAVLLPIFDKLNDLDEDTTTRIIDYVDSRAADALPSVWQWVIVLAAIYLLVVVLLTGKILLRYGRMNVSTAGDRLTVESGLISRFTSRLRRDKATTLTIKRNPLEKAVRCETISLRQAANATDKEAGGDIKIYGSNLGPELSAWWLGDCTAGEPGLSAGSGRGLFYRRFLPHLAIAVGAALLLIIAGHNAVIALTVCPAYVVLAAMRAVMARRHSRITLFDTFVAVSRGNIAEISEYIRYESIEAAGIRKTPFTRISGRVTLRISTNAGAVGIPSLKKDEAEALLNAMLDRSGEVRRDQLQ